MKKNLLITLLVLSIGMVACTYDPYKDDMVLPTETLTLASQNSDIVLDEDNMTAPVLTFTWTPAREVSDDYIVSYTTKLDVVGNNFGSTTVIRNDEEDGVYSRSFTYRYGECYTYPRGHIRDRQDVHRWYLFSRKGRSIGNT